MGEKGNGEASGATMSTTGTTEPPRTQGRQQAATGTVDPWDDPDNPMPTPEDVAADPTLGQLGPSVAFDELKKWGIDARSKAGHRYTQRFNKAIGFKGE